MPMFTKATKRAVKARVGLDGPTGSGKTFTALQWASVFGKKVALIDSERGSASLYADRYDFDVLEMSPPYEPERLVQALQEAEKEGYDVVVIDSLSHFWEGEGGVLDIVDGAAQRSHGNSFAGWKVGTPALRHLIDVMLGLDAHLIVTMRSKMEYVLEEDDRGKKVPKKIGMAPVMRAGVEYEFAVVADMDLEHRLSISKSRCEQLADQVYPPGRSQDGADVFKAWMETGEPVASRNEVDAVVSILDRIDDKDVRRTAKRDFLETFGRPEFLLASRLEEARTWASNRADGPQAEIEEGAAETTTASGEPGVEGDAIGESESTSETEAGPAPAAEGSPTGKAQPQPRWIAELHKYAKQVAKKHDLDDNLLLEACVRNMTNGRTSSTKDLVDQKEANRVQLNLHEIEDGPTTVVSEIDENGERYRVVTSRQLAEVKEGVPA